MENLTTMINRKDNLAKIMNDDGYIRESIALDIHKTQLQERLNIIEKQYDELNEWDYGRVKLHSQISLLKEILG